MKISHISHMMLYVRDQDEAKRFYTETLGFELGDDVPLGPDFRWLTVHLPGQESPLVCLMPPHAGKAPELAERVGELHARGVEFTEEPVERFYGIDAGFRDPSGNPWRLTQPAEVMGEVPIQA